MAGRNAPDELDVLMRDWLRVLEQRPSYLAWSAVGLFLAVTALLCVSLVSCRTGDKGGSRGASGAPATPRPPAVVFALSGIAGEPIMRVRVGAAVDTAVFTGPSELTISPASGDSAAPPAVASIPPLTVTLGADGWHVKDGTGAVTTWARAGDLQVGVEIAPGDRTLDTELVGYNGVRYPGQMRLSARSDVNDRAYDVIEYLPLEDYLPGVVSKEMYKDWPQTAYEAQAVCARTYALHERLRAIGARRPFDVEATTQDQAYGGVNHNGVVGAAVAATRGMVLVFRGQVLRAYYSSTCGGRAGSARDTWPITPGYEFNLAEPIQAHERDHFCQSSPNYRWSVVRDRSELVKRLRAYAEKNGLMVRQVKDLQTIEMSQANSVGRPIEYRVTEPGGRWFSVKAEDLRLACNQHVDGLADVTNKTRVRSGDIEFAIEPPKAAPAGKPRRSGVGGGGAVTISGRGSGHGVGMCQFCTKTMADGGRDWRTIVRSFYPGADLVRAY